MAYRPDAVVSIMSSCEFACLSCCQELADVPGGRGNEPSFLSAASVSGVAFYRSIPVQPAHELEGDFGCQEVAGILIRLRGAFTAFTPFICT